MTGARTLARRMRVRFAVAPAVAIGLSCAMAAPAAALEPGVFVDPGSPAGKEYGVPLSELRGAASGHAPAGNQSPPLFGIGISSAVGSVAASASGAPQRGSRQWARGYASGGRRSAAAVVLPGVTHHGSAVPAVALLGGLVVLGGLGFGGLLVAARRRLD